jgi:hypothetical protein
MKVCEGEQETNAAEQAPAGRGHEQEANNFEGVKVYLARYPEVTDCQIAKAVTVFLKNG